MTSEKPIKVIAENRKAYHEYFIQDKFEAGIVLTGTEVKSLRAGKINLKESYVQVKNAEMWLIGAHISPYEQGNRFNQDPMRIRKLLMHRREIIRLYSIVKQDGLTLIPTKCYFKNGIAKLEVALAKGKLNYDKRETQAKKSAEMDIARSLKSKSNQLHREV
jgi:SsrA-binding protein